MNFSKITNAKCILQVYIYLFTTSVYGQELEFDWAVSLNSQSNSFGSSCAVDENSDVYVVGRFYDSLDLDPGTGVEMVTSNGDIDIFIQKISANGTLIWGKSLGGTGLEGTPIVETDANGNCYVFGTFKGTVDFDLGNGVENRISNGESDCFLLKLDQTGNFLWVNTFGGSDIETANSICIDNATNSLYYTGGFQDTMTVLLPMSTIEIISLGGLDAFVGKVKLNGTNVWLKRIGGAWADLGRDVEVDQAGNLIVTGVFQDTADFGLGGGVELRNSQGFFDFFVQKISPNGDNIWVTTAGGTGRDYGNSVKVKENGEIVLTGYFQDTLDFGNGSGISPLISNGDKDIFILQLNENGGFMWSTSFGGNDEDSPSQIILEPITNNILVSGFFKNTVDFDPLVGMATSISHGSQDIFISRYDENGSFLSLYTTGSIGQDDIRGLDIDANGEVYGIGYFIDTVDFDNSSSTAILGSLPNVYTEFIVKFGSSLNTDEIDNGIVRIYPNPTLGKVTIELPSNDQYTIELISNNGRVLSSTDNGYQTVEVDLENYEAGIFYIKIFNGEETFVEKLIKTE